MSIADLAIKIAAADYATGVLGKVKNSIVQLAQDAKKLEASGDFAGAWMKRGEAIGKGAAWGAAGLGAMLGVHSKLAKMGDAQEGFAKIKVKTGKSIEEMKAFRAEIYKIAAETGHAPERILEAAISKAKKGMVDTEVFADLRQAGKLAKASFTDDVGGIISGMKAIGRQMNLTAEETRMTTAGLFEIAAGEGKLGVGEMMAASEGMLKAAKHLGITGAKGAVQVMAAAKFASRDMDAGAAVASVESLFSDMLAAKTGGALAKAIAAISNSGVDRPELKQIGCAETDRCRLFLRSLFLCVRCIGLLVALCLFLFLQFPPECLHFLSVQFPPLEARPPIFHGAAHLRRVAFLHPIRLVKSIVKPFILLAPLQYPLLRGPEAGFLFFP